MRTKRLRVTSASHRRGLFALGLLVSCGGGGDKGFSVVWEINPPSGPADALDSVVVRVQQDSPTTGVASMQLSAPTSTFFRELGSTNKVMAVASGDARTLTLVVDGLKGDKTVTQLNDPVNVSGAAQVTKTVMLPVPMSTGLACDPPTGMGCSNGQKCVYTPKVPATMPPSYEFKCGAAGPKMRGERCNNDNECGLGTLCGCLGPMGTPPCTCRKFCELGQDSRDCGMPSYCDVALPGSTMYRLCLDPCVLFQTMCPDGADCKVLGGPGKVACVAAGTIPEGMRCTRSSDCARGLACYPPTGTCQAQCDTTHACARGMCNGGICSGDMGAGGMGGGGMGVFPVVFSDSLSSAQLMSGEAWLVE